MSEKILQQILTEIKDMKSEMTSMKSQINENTEILKSIRDRQEETDALLENLSMDVHQMRGDLTSLTETVGLINEELKFTSHKTIENEKEIFKIRKTSLEIKNS